MTVFTPANPDFEARTRDSFARQPIMGLLGARLTRVAPGLVEIALPYRDDLTQQHGFFHAGVTGTLIPIGLEKLGVDPAIASSVFLTTVTDVVGFFAFLGLAAAFLL